MENINLEKVLKVIKPTKEENDKVMLLSGKLLNIINKIAKEMNISAEAVLVGSVAKETWLHGKADIDIFMKFPLNVDEALLKEQGLFLGLESIKKMNGKHELRYASHPYVTGFIEGLNVDFVPCYTINGAHELKSAVDRTILHTEYVKSKLKPEKKDEVLLLKKFTESIHTYGAEFKVGGFSGYLCELLIINYGSFIGVLEAASEKWHPKTVIDIEKYGTGEQFSEPMIVIDPTDKNRNVSAALTLQKISEFIISSRNFLANPKEEYFADMDVKLDLNVIKNEFKQRKTNSFIIKFKSPQIPADALYPQIKKTENSIRGVLEREEFKVFDADSWTDEKNNVLILIEMETWKLPNIKKHYGPFVWSKTHQERFLEKYNGKTFVEDDRWVVEIEREYKDAKLFIEDILNKNKIGYLKFGKHIKNEILKEHQIIDILEFLESSECNENMLLFFCEYLHKSMYLSR
ncbi:MAG: CCA tRNA nucleotidyltransferase [Methanobacterium sp.]|uniref:CCA tRNA nucleotidyltransferase n=1 Tax=Methanobacterium sp. TaxID=2164 RepID=UPI003D64F273|nr:CCA tRNA nucleotidyltransferase [Methanobacterium sp.]